MHFLKICIMVLFLSLVVVIVYAADAMSTDITDIKLIMVFVPAAVVCLLIIISGMLLTMWWLERRERMQSEKSALDKILAYKVLVDTVVTQTERYNAMVSNFNSVVDSYRAMVKDIKTERDSLMQVVRDVTEALHEIRELLAKEGVVLRQMQIEKLEKEEEKKNA